MRVDPRLNSAYMTTSGASNAKTASATASIVAGPGSGAFWPSCRTRWYISSAGASVTRTVPTASPAPIIRRRGQSPAGMAVPPRFQLRKVRPVNEANRSVAQNANAANANAATHLVQSVVAGCRQSTLKTKLVNSR